VRESEGEEGENERVVDLLSQEIYFLVVWEGLRKRESKLCRLVNRAESHIKRQNNH